MMLCQQGIILVFSEIKQKLLNIDKFLGTLIMKEAML